MIINRLAAATAIVLSTQIALVTLCSGVASQASSAEAATASANGTIGLSTGNFAVNEASGSVVVTAVRTGATKGAMSVAWQTANGTALAPTNYTAASGTLKWADGDGSSKTFTIAINSKAAISSSEWFKVKLTAGADTVMGSHSNAMVTISAGTATSTPTTPAAPPVVVKSIKEWGVVCNDTTDQSSQLSDALTAAAGGAFTLQIDCPVRFHTGTDINHTINVPDGVTVQVIGSGELLTVSGGATALNMPHPTAVTLIGWNLTYL